MNRNVKRSFRYITQKTITCASDKAFVYIVEDLTTILEGLSTDGVKPIVKKIRFLMHAYSTTATNHPVICYGIVQTAGTITDTVNLNEENAISTNLASCIDDEFGFQLVNQPKGSKLAPNDGATHTMEIIQNLDVPQNVINLLNKEVNTERLQGLNLVAYGVQLQTGTTVLRPTMYIEWIERSKGITIR